MKVMKLRIALMAFALTVGSAASNVNAQSKWTGFDSLNQRIQSNIYARMSGGSSSNKCVTNCGESNGSGSGRSATATWAHAPKYLGRFKSDRAIQESVTGDLVNSLSDKPEQRAQLKQIIDSVRLKYDREARSKGWQDNLAGSMTYFFIVISTVYYDSDPSAEMQDALYAVINQVLDETPELANAPSSDKQKLNDLLVGYTALPLATYAEAKQNGSAETLKTAKLLAKGVSQLVFKSDPMRF